MERAERLSLQSEGQFEVLVEVPIYDICCASSQTEPVLYSKVNFGPYRVLSSPPLNHIRTYLLSMSRLRA